MSAGRAYATLAGFRDTSNGRIFSITFDGDGAAARPPVIVCPPFAEEMNKCRRAMAQFGRRAAGHGWRVTLPDLSGTGDSAGDFAEATAERWIADVETAASDAGDGVILLGIRFGALLAAAVAARRNVRVRQLLFWQPVPDGAAMLTQMERLELSARAIRDAGDGRLPPLAERLSSGAPVEISGYPVGRPLFESLQDFALDKLLGPDSPPVNWWERAPGDSGTPGPGTRRRVEALNGRGARIEAQGLGDVSFWSSVEIETPEQFIAATLDWLGDWQAADA